MSSEQRVAGWFCLGLLLAVSAGAAPKKGVSLDDLVPTRKPPAAPRKPAPRKTAPRPAVKKAAAPVVKRPAPPAAAKAPAPRPGSPLLVGPGAPYRTLGDALRKAPAGARILVREGTYRESLILTKPVEIAPARPEDVVVVQGGARPAIVLRTTRATLRQLTVRMAPGAGQAAYAVEVPQGELLLEDCTLASGTQACLGVRGAQARSTLRKCRLQGETHGLRVDNQGAASLEECEVSQNGGAGVFVSGGGTANLQGCRIAENGGQGLVFIQGAHGLVVDCNVTANRTLGVSVESGSDPVLRNTRVFRNALAGVSVDTAGKGVLQDCDLYENGTSGLMVRGKGSLAAQNSKFRANQGDGIECVQGGSARIENGAILENGTVGVAVRGGSEFVLVKSRIVAKALDAVLANGKSQVTLDGCEISKAPGGAGVAVHEGSQAMLRFCQIRGGKWGILSSTGSDLTLDECDLSLAESDGFHASETSGLLRACRIFRNEGGGIKLFKCLQLRITQCEVYGNRDTNLMVIDGSTPKVTRCSFRDSQRAGIWIAEGSQGTFEDCEIRGNTLAGLAVDKNGNPEMRKCRFLNGRAPGGHGIWIGVLAKGLFEDCIIEGNGANGAHIDRGGNPLFRRCRISDNAGTGIVSTDGGLGTVEDSEVVRNRGGSALSRGTGRLVIRASRTD